MSAADAEDENILEDENPSQEEENERDKAGQLIERFLANLDGLYQAALSEDSKAFESAASDLKKANLEILAPLKVKAKQAESSSIKSYLLDVIDYLQDVLIHRQIITGRKILQNPFDEKAHALFWKILSEVTNSSKQALEAADDVNDLADDEWLDQHEEEVADQASPAEFLLGIVAKEWAQLMRAAKRGSAQKVEEFVDSVSQANQEAIELILAEEANAPGIDPATKDEIQTSTQYLQELLGDAFDIARALCAPGVDPALQDYFREYDSMVEDLMEHVNDVITFTSEAEEEADGITSLDTEEKENAKAIAALFEQYTKAIRERSLMYVESSCEELVSLVNGIASDADELLDEIEDEQDKQPVIEHVEGLVQLVQELEELKATRKPGDESYPQLVEDVQREMSLVLHGLYEQIGKQRKREAEGGGAKRAALRKAFSKEKTLQQDLVKLVKKLAKEKDGPAKKKLATDFKKLVAELKASRDKVAELRQRSEQKKKRITAFRKRKQRKAREAGRLRKLDMYEQMSEALRLDKEQLQRDREMASRKWHDYKRNMTQAGRSKGTLLKLKAGQAAAAAANAAGTQPAPAAAAAAVPPPSAAAAAAAVAGGGGAAPGEGAGAGDGAAAAATAATTTAAAAATAEAGPVAVDGGAAVPAAAAGDAAAAAAAAAPLPDGAAAADATASSAAAGDATGSPTSAAGASVAADLSAPAVAAAAVDPAAAAAAAAAAADPAPPEASAPASLEHSASVTTVPLAGENGAPPRPQLRKTHSLPLHQSPLGALLPDKSAMMTSRFRTLDKEASSEKRDALLQSLPRAAPQSQLQPLGGSPLSRSPSNASGTQQLQQSQQSQQSPQPLSLASSPSLTSSQNMPPPPSFSPVAGSAPFGAAPSFAPASASPGSPAAGSGSPLLARAVSSVGVNAFDKHNQLKPMAIVMGKPVPPPLTAEQLAEQQKKLDRERIQAAHRKQLEALKRKALEAQS